MGKMSFTDIKVDKFYSVVIQIVEKLRTVLNEKSFECHIDWSITYVTLKTQITTWSANSFTRKCLKLLRLSCVVLITFDFLRHDDARWQKSRCPKSRERHRAESNPTYKIPLATKIIRDIIQRQNRCRRPTNSFFSFFLPKNMKDTKWASGLSDFTRILCFECVLFYV